ncbi:MAG: (Fe-S)-binding protein [Candidatus Thorarchaeota archaeon]
MMDEQEILRQARLCAACPKMCRHVCPTFFAWRSDSPTPHGRALLIYNDLMGFRKLDERSVEVLYQCLECSHCLTWCLPQVDVASMVESVRSRLVSQHRQPMQLTSIEEKVVSTHNPFGEPHSSRTGWLDSPQSDGTPITYFVGCTSSYREQSIAKSTATLLQEVLGYSVRVAQDEWCCGSPLFRTGALESALAQARHNADLINAMDGEMIVTSCPGCFRTLTQDYPRHGVKLKRPVVHISQLMWSRENVLPSLSGARRVTYHDPCHLGRHSGIYDEPRSLIRRLTGDGLVEMERSRENAMCCGNGAGLRALAPEKSRLIASERISQARQVGAELVVTSCPFCKNILDEVSGHTGYVVDISEFVLDAIRGKVGSLSSP